MTTPTPRTPVRPARGYYAVILNDLTSLQEGELAYAKDQNTLYVKEGSALVPVLGSGAPATSGLQAGDNITQLVNNAGYITLSDVPEDRVLSVNGLIGSVVLTADHVPTAGTINKFTTQQDINKLAGIQVGAEVNVNADWNAASGDARILNKPVLGTAAAEDVTDFASAAQGALADSALQPSDNVSSLTNDAGYATVSRSMTSITTAATANTSGTVSLPKSGLALKIYTSKAGWFRLYNNAAASSADSARTQGTDPTPGSGVLFETATTAGQTIVLTPVPAIANMESPVTNSYSWRFNNSTDVLAATIEIYYVSIEA